MKNAKTVLIGMLVTAVALSALITPATAAFVHPRGIFITTYPQDILLMYWGRPGQYANTLALTIKPPWYFVSGLMGFSSVTLTLTLTGSCYQCRPGENPPTLAGAYQGQLVVQLGAVTMQEANNGAVLLCPITFNIDSSTSRGYYMLFLSAEALASDGTIFLGWDQIPVALVG